MVESVGTGPSAHMPTWAGAIPSIYTNWGKITLRERPGGPGRREAGHEPAVCAGSPEGQLFWAALKKGWPAGTGR